MLSSQIGLAQVGSLWIGGVETLSNSSTSSITLIDSLLIWDSTLEIRVNIAFVPIDLLISDILQFNDNPLSGFNLNPSETLYLVDDSLMLISGSIIDLLISDYFIFSDSVSDTIIGVVTNISLIFSDTLNLNELIVINPTEAFSYIVAEDFLMLTDSQLVIISISEVLNDLLNLNDANGVYIKLDSVILEGLSDTLQLVDVVSTQLLSTLTTFNDQLLLSDLIHLSIQSQNAYMDSLDLSDEVFLLLAPLANLQFNDTLVISDNVVIENNSIFTPINLNISDNLLLQDAVSLSDPSIVTFTDNFILVDSFVFVISSDLNPYLRRYLNDVIGVSNP